LDTNAPRLHLSRSQEVVWIEGSVQDNRTHEHHALQIIWSSRDAPLTLRINGTTLSCHNAIIDGRVPHAVEFERGLIALIDTASPLAKGLRSRHLDGRPFVTLEGVTLRENRSHQEHLRQLMGEEPSPVDARIQDVLTWLDVLEREGRWAEASLEQALQRACLSRGRFRHLFSAHVGSPWRTYLVWRRALVAITLANGGVSLTRAAHEAGYSDSAHLSRQFLMLFGFSPMALLKNSHFVQSD
jgi:AraC-like DNA-binding protein